MPVTPQGTVPRSGPDLQSGTDLILAISAYGKNADCKAPALSQRLDTPEAVSFIGGFLH